MGALFEVERQRRTRLNIFFGLLAIAPFALRQGWFLIRGDFISLSDLPLGNILVPVYQAFLSSLSGYVFVAGGVLLAIYVVGLPRFKLPALFGMAFKK